MKVIEREKIGRQWVDRVLYSGNDQKVALTVEYFETKCYHRRKIERTPEGVVIVLQVDS